MLTQEMTRQEAMTNYEWVEPIPFTDETAAEAAEVYTELRADGAMSNRNDIYIAATAHALGVPLVVADDHFGAVDGLDIETYRE
jgi:tRNA(fMet)-specific endonuclease VapC